MPVSLSTIQVNRAAGFNNAVADEDIQRLIDVASALVENYAPGAPQAILDTAAIRCIGWLAESPASTKMSTDKCRGRVFIRFGPKGCLEIFRGDVLVESVENPKCRGDFMKWPWQTERRQAGGGYTDQIVDALEAAAASQAAGAGSSAAVECAAGALSRAFMAAKVSAPSSLQDVVNPNWLAMVGRSLIRDGASLSVIKMDGGGRVELVPAAFWNFESVSGTGESEESWQCRVSSYSPSSSHTRLIDRDGLVFVRWGSAPGTRYQGRGPTSWASLSARTASETERSLGDEAAGPLGQMIAVPSDGGDGGDDDVLKTMKTQIGAARGKALLLEPLAMVGLRVRLPLLQVIGKPHDWGQLRHRRWLSWPLRASTGCWLRAAFLRHCSTILMAPVKRGLRRFHLGLVLPMARLLEHELSKRLDANIKLRFDNYPTDLAGRAMAFQKLVSGGKTASEATAIAGLMVDDDG